MSCTTSNNIRVEPCSITWGKKTKVCFEAVTDLAGGENFKISTPLLTHVVWFKVNAVGTAPTLLTGEVAVEITLASSYTAAAMRTAMKTALEAVGYWIGTMEDSFFAIESKTIGAPLLAPVVGTYTGDFEIIVSGAGGDLGKTEGGLEVALETTSLEVKADQTGELLIEELITGFNASVKMSLLEMTAEKWALIVGEGMGQNLTPSTGTQLTGFGSGKLSASMLSQSGELVLHPIAQGASKLRDITFWKCVPMPESINFSGTETQKMSISFKAYLDETKNEKINLFAFGDGAQDVR